MSSTTVAAAKIVGIGAAIGGALGAVGGATSNANVVQSTVNGAVGGTALVALGSLVWAVFSSASRDEALEAAAIGLGATIVGGLIEPAV